MRKRSEKPTKKSRSSCRKRGWLIKRHTACSCWVRRKGRRGGARRGGRRGGHRPQPSPCPGGSGAGRAAACARGAGNVARCVEASPERAPRPGHMDADSQKCRRRWEMLPRPKPPPKTSPDPLPEPRITVFSLCFFLFQGLVSQEKALLWNKCESYMSMDLIQSKNYWHFVTYFSLNVGNRLTPGRLGAFPSHPLRFGGLTLRLGGGRGGGGARIRKLLLLYICIFSSWPLYCVLHCCYCSAWQAPV